jgi:uncharacterized repeat protein (TIGR02059 family)
MFIKRMRAKSKALIILGLALLMFFSFTGQTFAQPADIQGHWAENEISDWVSKGFITGYQDGTFRPDFSITRAEFVTLVNRAFGFTASSQADFSDVSSTDWFAAEIARAKAAGYISGYEDGTFRPNTEISRQEVAAMLSRMLKLEPPADLTAVSKFKDAVNIPQWSKGFIDAVVTGGLMNGYPDHTYRAEKAITRAEAIITLNNAVTVKENSVNDNDKPAAPVYVNSQVTTKGDVSITFDKDMADPAGKQAQFVVSVDGVEDVVTAVQSTETPKKIKLVMATKVVGGQVVTVTYTKGADDASRIKSADGGVLDSFGPETVTNNLAGAAAPVYVSSEVTTKGDVSITFDKDLADPAGKQAQFVVIVDGVENVVTAVQSTNTPNKIKLVLTTKVEGGQVVTLTYTKGADDASQVKSADGGVLDSFGPVSVTNS